MGCDIHGIVQVRNENGVWETKKDIPFYDDRNYQLFALLADVRNRNNLKPIDSPRGLPQEIQDYIDTKSEEGNFYEDVWLGEHSHSWLFLSEIKGLIGSNITYPNSGVVSRHDYLEAKSGNGIPDCYCQGIFGGNNVTITEEEYHKFLNGESLDVVKPNSVISIRMNWQETLEQMAPGFVKFIHDIRNYVWNEDLEYNKKYPNGVRQHGTPNSDIRLVFGFDS